MKGFEKHWLEFRCKTPINCGVLRCRDCRIVREESWREALEWVRKQRKPIFESHPDLIDPVAIDKELNS